MQKPDDPGGSWRRPKQPLQAAIHLSQNTKEQTYTVAYSLTPGAGDQVAFNMLKLKLNYIRIIRIYFGDNISNLYSI